MDLLDAIKGEPVADRIGPEVLGDGQQSKDHLESVEKERDDEIRIRDALSPVAHGWASSSY